MKKLVYIFSLRISNYIFLKKNEDKKNFKNFKIFIFSFFADFLFFVKIKGIYDIFIFKKNNILLLTQMPSIVTLLKKTILKYTMESLKGNFITLVIKGRNYKFFYENNYLIIFLGFCHYVYIKIPKNILIYSITTKNTKLLLYSLKKNELLNFSFFLKKLYKRDVYKGKGIYFINDFIKLKEGKKKEFF